MQTLNISTQQVSTRQGRGSTQQTGSLRTGGDRYRPRVISMLEEAGYSVSDSTRAQDRREASDLMITVADDTLSDTQQACTQQGCALRIRSEKALQFWPDDFTFRALRPQCGDDTEFRKIMEGHARYALYGFTDHVDAIVLMRMLDLDILRTSILSDPDRYDRPVIQGQYGVGYLVFNIHEFPEHFVRETWDFRH